MTGVSAVEHLVLNFINNPPLTWSPPSFYSNDIPHGSIITYHVYVVNQNGSIIVDDNTTDTFYQLPTNFTDYDIYTASVTAFVQHYSSPVVTITKQKSESKIIYINHSFNVLSLYQIIIKNLITIISMAQSLMTLSFHTT